MYKNEYLPTKCWFKNGELHRAYYVYDEYVDESPRDWNPLSIIVNASGYSLCGKDDISTNDIEEWLIRETGINEEWYWNNKERYGGIDRLIEKFKKEKCVAFSYLSVYDHSGVSVFCGYARGWDYSAIGFVYVPKDCDEVKADRKTHSLKETEEWADKLMHSEIECLNQYVSGEVYGVIEEVYDTETDSWDEVDSVFGIYLDPHNEKESALQTIKDNYGTVIEFFDMDEIETAIKNNTLDVYNGQILLPMEIA